MRFSRLSTPFAITVLSSLPARVLCDQIFSTDGFTTCVANPTLNVLKLDVQFDKTTANVTFDVAGESDAVQNVTASLTATAYGRQVYSNEFNPCSPDTFVKEICPVPEGVFSAQGVQTIPQQYLDKIPSIAFSIPDLDGQVTLQLKDTAGNVVACIQTAVTNGKTLDVPAVKYVAAGVAASAFALSAVGAVSHAAAMGASGPSPAFGEVVGWFQTIATSGMLSVNYPSVYQSFTRNFAFSTGLIAWAPMQTAIDNFRKSTGGNLTDNNYQYLQNVTVVNAANSNSTVSSLFKRTGLFATRQVTASVNGQTTSIGGGASSTTTDTAQNNTKPMHYVSGIEGYVEQLMIPSANTFMTVLLIFLAIVLAITVVIMLFKVLLELLAMGGRLPKSLESFRKRYWWRLAKVVTSLIFIMYGSWVLYCMYQFTIGDSWATKALAGITLLLFTALLGFFAFKIWSKAHAFKKMDGDSSGLFEDKEVWIKYSLFYDAFKQGCWWIFIPAIVYMFARNAVIAAGNGHGMAQAIGQMIVEGLMLLLLIFRRPYQRRSGNVINIIIQTVRMLSVICILIFVEELGFSQTTKTITGLALIVMQSVLTGLLALLLAINAIMACVKENPHRKRRKEAERAAQRDMDNLTPLDARNSLLMESKSPLVSKRLSPTTSFSSYDRVSDRDLSPPSRGDLKYSGSRENLVNHAEPMAGWGVPEETGRKPTLPDVGFGRPYY